MGSWDLFIDWAQGMRGTQRVLPRATLVKGLSLRGSDDCCVYPHYNSGKDDHPRHKIAINLEILFPISPFLCFLGSIDPPLTRGRLNHTLACRAWFLKL